MIDIFSILSTILNIIIWIGITAGLFWIWKKRTWPKSTKVFVTIAILGGLLIYVGLFLIIAYSPNYGLYIAQCSNLGKINLDEVISKAQKSGYKVDVPSGVDVSNVKIIFPDKEREYIIDINRLGDVCPRIELSAGQEIPEEEYRGIFNKMFVNLGLPPEKVDEFKFNDNPMAP
jgi:ABC-type siderophore export system fused ATPase/permease subunit